MINWRNFSIGAGEITRFRQPSAAAAALNRVTGDQVSRIMGRLTANGRVFLVNPNGIVFGPGSRVDVAALVAATHDIRDRDFLDGRLDFTLPGDIDARIVNEGLISARDGGLVALVAPSVANSGVIQARLGRVAIAGGNSATIDPYGDDLIVFQADSKVVDALTDADHNPLAALVDITGEITADGGRVLITADMARGVVNGAINMTGIVEARTVETRNGEIVLRGGAAGATTIAGTLDATGHGDGETGGRIDVSGGLVMHLGAIDASGSAGGSVAVSGQAVLLQGSIAADGGRGDGGAVSIDSARTFAATESSVVSATGGTAGDGGRIVIDGGAAGSVYSSGAMRTTADGGTGGLVDVFGDDIRLVAARIDASGADGGGGIRIGGDYQGGGDAPHAARLHVSAATAIAADALGVGGGGTVILWSDAETRAGGTISARGGPGGGDGGLIEVSSKETAIFGGTADAGALLGTAGTFLLDPKNIVIDAAAGFPMFDLLDPLAGTAQAFGNVLMALPNGNLVVGDYLNDVGGIVDSGAVHLFNGFSGALINTVTGTTAGDQIGSGEPMLLDNGNYLISSLTWTNGGSAGAGAVTWGSATTGIAGGTISAANSLVGSTANDSIGSVGIFPLPGGNYVVASSNWDNGAIVDAGAATWGNGATGTAGVVSTANSLYGSTAGDSVSSTGVTVLSNGNYVVRSEFWDDPGGPTADVGAATWGSGATGITGAVSTANSLHGTTAGDRVGTVGVALSNGNYVIGSPTWANGATLGAGAATWGNGTTGITGAVSTLNSLYGTTVNDGVGIGVTALDGNGNYVVSSQNWDDPGGPTADVGAATWGNGATGITGAVSTANSLYGATASDFVGVAVMPLSNGNYVVQSPQWDDPAGPTADVGAATWADGTTGIAGLVTTANSLYGGTVGDGVGANVAALSNGNYVVGSPVWDDPGGPTTDAGAATWGNGTTGTAGLVSTANSLYGAAAGDSVGSTVAPLTNGHYVVASPGWNASAGAATWGNGTTGVTGVVSAANSLIGSTTNDQVGSGVTPLTNGNYVVVSPLWDDPGGPTTDAGAATWADGTTGITGAVSTANSIHGTTANDRVGEEMGTANVIDLTNGDFIVISDQWSGGTGASTMVDGTNGQTFDGLNAVSAVNSITGIINNGTEDLANNTMVIAFAVAGGAAAVVMTDPNQATFGRGAAATMTLRPDMLTASLELGTAITLQASNDITVNSPIVTVAGGAGGNLTLQAGRSVLVNADIVTDNGDLTLIANEVPANGVVDAQRDPGAAAISMAAATLLDAGTGNLSLQLHTGAGLTNSTSGAITLNDITGGTVSISNDGPTAGSNIDFLAGATLTSSGTMSFKALNGGLNAAGALNVNLAGPLTVSEPFTAAGTVTIAAGGVNDVSLANAANDFTNLAITGANNVTVADANALVIDASAMSGGLTASAADGVTINGSVSTNGAVSVNADSNADGVGDFILVTAMNVSTTNGAFMVTADDVDIQGTINAGAGAVSLGPASLSAMGLGATPSLAFDVDNAELGNITTTGTVTLGNASAGTVTVDGLTYAGAGPLAIAATHPTGSITFATTQTTVAGMLDLSSAGAISGGVGGGDIAVNALTVASTSMVLTGTIAGQADQAATDSIALTRLGAGPYLFNGFEVPDPLASTLVDQQSAQISTLPEDTNTATETTTTGEDPTAVIIVEGDGTSSTIESSMADDSDSVVESAERIVATGSLTDAIAYFNDGGGSPSEVQETFYSGLDGPKIVDDLQRSNDLTAQQIGRVFEEVMDGREVSQGQMRAQLNVMGVRGGWAMSYLGLFSRVQKHSRTKLYGGAIAELASDADSAGGTVAAPTPGRRVLAGSGRKIALLIGVDDYRQPMPRLRTPVRDVEAVGRYFRYKLGYDTMILRNGTKRSILAALQHFVNTLGQTDSLVIYFAGHGYIVESTGVGYWLPSDAESGSARNWISNRLISEFLNNIQAKRIMLIADSCYSGSLISGEHRLDGVRVQLSKEDLDGKRSVVILSSGGEEPVQDEGGQGHSVFARQLMTVLDGMDTDRRGVDLYRDVKERVTRLAPQVPHYGGIVSAGHSIGADHVFNPLR